MTQHLLHKRAGDFGFKFDNLSYDWKKIISRSRAVADKLAGGVEFLFKKNKIDYLRGEASVAGEGKVSYKTKEGTTKTDSSAFRSSDFVGMQPQFRQVPPALSFSTQATFLPSCEARIAPT
jgi:hypothetical protein